MTSEPVLDIRGALARLDGDEELLVDLIHFFLEDVSRLQDELKQGLAVGDLGQARMSTHALKGLVSGCGGVRAAEAAKRVENAAQSGDAVRAATLTDDLSKEIEILRLEAEGYLA